MGRLCFRVRAEVVAAHLRAVCFSLCLCQLIASTCMAQQPREPGFDELEVIPPSDAETKESGAPAVVANAETGEYEIRPTRHFHRYYYTGDRVYQGPRIAGGPTIVMARHPSTRKPLKVEVMLPPGTPEIAYSRYSITYIYPDKRVKLLFSRVLKDRVAVKVLPCSGIRYKVATSTRKLARHTTEKVRSSPVKQSLKGALVQRKNIVMGVAGVASRVVTGVVDRSGQVLRLLPGAQLLESAGERYEEEREKARVRYAAAKQEETATKFIRTVR